MRGENSSLSDESDWVCALVNRKSLAFKMTAVLQARIPPPETLIAECGQKKRRAANLYSNKRSVTVLYGEWGAVM